jgi:PAS domain S-box-containing protein
MIGGMTDLTDRIQSQQRIAEQAALIDQAHDAIVVRDLNHHIVFWNKGAERIYGWTTAEAAGRRFAELLKPDVLILEHAEQELQEKGEWTGELQQITKAGEKVALDCRWTLLRDQRGEPKSYLHIDTDITEHKKIEQQFLRAQRMESIGTLAGGIAHDLNNVLGPIIMSLELMNLRFEDDESRELISIIGSSARRGADMVSQVLSFARGVDGERIEVQVKHLLQDIQKIANDTFLKNIQVRTVVPRDLWPVLGDPTQLHQVLLNLCVNARDAMPTGGTLTLTAQNTTLDAHYAGLILEAKPGLYVLIQVEDSGTGISEETLEKIFEPFFTTKELGKGTGLGLSTSLAIVKSHGGFIQIYTELGRGSTFKVYLPAQAASAASAVPAAELDMPRGFGEKILVVDDEGSVRQITKQTLEAFGYRVVLACDGVEAIAAFARDGAEIAAVITDMMMPVMDGPATIQVLRKMNADLPIIAASGLSTSNRVTEVANLGVQHFLSKPYTTQRVLQVLKKVLEGRRSTTASNSGLPAPPIPGVKVDSSAGQSH